VAAANIVHRSVRVGGGRGGSLFLEGVSRGPVWVLRGRAAVVGRGRGDQKEEQGERGQDLMSPDVVGRLLETELRPPRSRLSSSSPEESEV
jgi:hypothetical protein